MGRKNNGLKKNLIWDKTLFAEGVRQTVWMALATAAVCAWISNYYILPALFGVIMVCVMLYRLLRFSNKRSSSDFYNSLCRSRLCVYFTYLSVVLMWIILFTLVFYTAAVVIEHPSITKTAYESFPVIDIRKAKIIEAGNLFAALVLAMGAFSLSMASTGNAIMHGLTMLIILFAPRFLCSYVLTAYYDLVPFIITNRELNRVVNNDLNIIYNIVNELLPISNNCVSLFDPKLIPVVYSSVLGIVFIILGAVLFRKKKAEDAGVVALNRFWKLILRSVLALVIAIAADFSLAKYIFNGVHADTDIATIVVIYLISILLWLIFDLFTGKFKKVIFKSLTQLPVFVVLNAVIVCGLVMCGNKASEVPAMSDIKTVSIVDVAVNFRDNKYADASEKIEKMVQLAGSKYLQNDDVSKIIIERLNNDMLRFRSPSVNYTMDADSNYNVDNFIDRGDEFAVTSGVYSNDYMLVSIETESDTIYRFVTLDSYMLQQIAECYILAAENIYDYELPIKYVEETDNEKYPLGCFTSFTWGFTYENIREIYNCLYEEIKENKLPLKSLLDPEYNLEGTFEFLTFQDETRNSDIVYLPIGIKTPKTLEKLAETSNNTRTDFDLQWFIDYVNSIGNEEKGACLDLLLYTGKEPNIRYETFSFWSDYTADLSDENLNKILEITNAHKDDNSFSADENILIVLYRKIEGKDPTCKWINISDEEAEIVESMIWKEGYFNVLDYANIYYSY